MASDFTTSLRELLLNTAGPNPPHREGRVFYDSTENTLVAYNDEPAITHQIGQEMLVRVFNDTGATIPNGSPVYITGTELVEFRPTVALAQANTLTSSEVIGVTTHDIPNGEFGYATELGRVNGIDTSAFAAGAQLYLSETTPGGMRDSLPPEGSFVTSLGFVTRSHATAGSILVNANIDLASASGRVGYRFETTTQNANRIFFETGLTTYESAIQFVFPGTGVLTVPPSLVQFVVSADQNSVSCGFRLFDVTNAQIIAEADPVTVNLAPTILTLSAPANLPTGEALFEVQTKTNIGGRKSRVSYAHLVRQ